MSRSQKGEKSGDAKRDEGERFCVDEQINEGTKEKQGAEGRGEGKSPFEAAQAVAIFRISFQDRVIQGGQRKGEGFYFAEGCVFRTVHKCGETG